MPVRAQILPPAKAVNSKVFSEIRQALRLAFHLSNPYIINAVMFIINTYIARILISTPF